MNVPYTVCEFEADDEIAAMARHLNCPVLSYDSDFFIYNVLYIPFNTLDFKPKPVEINNTKTFVLECKIYKVEYMLKNFGGLKEELLPLLATLLGNDFVEKKVFKKFFSQLKLPKTKKKSNDQQKCIHGLFQWLQNETLESAIEKILGRLKKKEKQRVLYVIKKSIDGYHSKHCRSLKYFNLTADETPESDWQLSEDFEKKVLAEDDQNENENGEDENANCENNNDDDEKSSDNEEVSSEIDEEIEKADEDVHELRRFINMTETQDVMPENKGEEITENEESSGSEVEEISDLESSIILQVEYYFSDRNMRRDEFLQRTLRDYGGWLPLTILIRFNQLAKLTRNMEIIAKALKKSSGFLEVSEDNKKVRRRPDAPVPELTAALEREITNRSIYAKGYPRDTSFDDLIMHYKKYDVENIMMRKFQREPLARVFKGSVYITFKTREQAEEFKNGGPHTYQGRPLKVLWQADYLAMK
ncbi:hypothetical protein PYW07_000799 [Mythimna separata]|uniref:HTH La-type RNA-binding domain-containing protein n=1 Tax=Mythimna separata TaxID=271217 RepID=A0AAD8DV96_MYTSE|nr:hypothetical protein PYW07_000799 [Mythimna separata]